MVRVDVQHRGWPAAMISAASIAPGISAVSAAMTVRSDGTVRPVDALPRRRPGPVDNCRGGLDDGDLAGEPARRAGQLSGTATAPMPSKAR